MHRLPQLRLRLSELTTLRDEYDAKGNRGTMVSYITTLIADAENEIEAIERSADQVTNPVPKPDEQR